MTWLIVQRKVNRLGGTERYAWDILRTLMAYGEPVELLHQAPIEPIPDLKTTQLSTRLHGLPALVHFMFRARTHVKRRKLRQFSGLPLKVLSLDRTLEQEALRLGGGCHWAWLEACEGWVKGRPPWKRPLQLRNRLLLWWERKVMRSPKLHLLTVSHHMRQELRQYYPHLPEAHIHVLPNGVDLQRFSVERAPEWRAVLRRNLDLTSERFVLLFVGTGAHRKGLDRVLRAFQLLLEAPPLPGIRPEDRPAPFLLLVGGDVQAGLATYRQTYAPPPSFYHALRWLPRTDDIQMFYAAADLLLLPARYEPFGNVCLESMAMGTPAITTRCNGVSELYSDALEHLLLEAELPEERMVERLVEKLRWLESPLHRAKVTGACLSVAQANRLEVHVDRLSRLLRMIAAETG